MVHLHKIHSWYLRAVGRVEMPESSSGRRCQELLGTMAGREGLVTHSHRDWLAHTLEQAVVTYLGVEKGT